VHQGSLYNKESRQQTGHQTFYLFILIYYFNCALATAPQQEVMAPDGAPDFFSFIF
jgi:hypothetical protein